MSTYSALAIELMVTGENATTWGNVTNINLGTALEEAIVGSADVTFASADVTLTLALDNGSQNTRNMRLRCSGVTGGSTRNLIVPKTAGTSASAFEKPYIVQNDCADSIVVKHSTGTGITVPAGKTMWVYADGTNVVDVVTHLTSLTLGTPLAVLQGGTGSNIASGARTNLGATTVGSNLFTLANPSAITFPRINADNSVSTLAAATFRTAIGSTTLGDNLFIITNPSAVTFPRFNADNTVSALSASDFRTAIGAGTGTVSSVGGTGSVNGITLTGTVTSTGNLTLGGTLSGVSLTTQVTGTLPIANGGTGSTSTAYCSLTTNVTGTLPVGNGGTGATTLTGVLKGNGTSAFSAATAGTDYVAPGGALGTPSSGNLANCTFPTLNQNTTGSSGSCTGNAATATSATTAGTATNATNLVTTNFSIVESGGVLYFKYGGTNIAKLESNGAFTALNNVTGFGSI